MRCSKATKHLQLYIDKRLALEQIRSLETHLSTCVACRRELFLLEEIEQSVQGLELVVEPSDLTRNIMQRVALSARKSRQMQKARRYQSLKRARSEEHPFLPFRPSLAEIGAAVLLATVVTLGLTLGQPALRAMLPFANGHDSLSLFFIQFWNMLLGLNSHTLMVVFWVMGTLLGIWITLVLAGEDMRSQWFKAMMDRLPVW